MDKQKQEEMAKLEIEKSAGFYFAFINDMRISRNKPASVSKTIMTFRCPKKYILQAIGIPENAVVLKKEEYERLLKIEKDFNTVHYCFVEKSRVEETRKETAEKFAEMVSKAFIGLNCIDIDEWNWCQRKIDEICEEISEGQDGNYKQDCRLDSKRKL